jgi:amino acid transporter
MTEFELPSSSDGNDVVAVRASSLGLGRAFGLGFASLGMGAGLIATPAGTMVAGNGAWLVFIVSVVIIACLVVAVSAFARRYVVTGSLMSYLGDAFGAIPRTIAGAALLVAYTLFCSISLIYPLTFAQGFLLDLHRHWLDDSSGRILFFVTVAMLLGYISHRGASASARSAIALTVLSLPLVLVLFIAVIMKNGIAVHEQITLHGGSSVTAIIAGVVIFAGTYVGFEGFTALAAETKDPIRNIPTILVGLLATIAVGYFFATIIATPVLLQHASQIAAGDSPSAVLADASDVSWLKTPLDFALVLNLMAGLVPLLNDGSRVIATAARDGMLPMWVGRIDPHRRIPARALWLLVAIIMMVAVAAEVFAHAAPLKIVFALTPAVFFLWMIPYMGMCLGLIALCKRRSRPYGMQSLAGAVGFLLIAFLFCYQISHPASGLEQASSAIALTLFAIVCVVTFIRHRRFIGRY